MGSETERANEEMRNVEEMTKLRIKNVFLIRVS